MFDKLQPAVRKETKRVAAMTAAGVVLMWIVFAVLHFTIPESTPFNYTVFLGGLGGGFVAILNFFMMALTVQKIASTEDEENARALMKSSYSRRMLLQMVWVVLAIVLPFTQFAAGIVPLLFPSLGIKMMGILNK